MGSKSEALIVKINKIKKSEIKMPRMRKSKSRKDYPISILELKQMMTSSKEHNQYEIIKYSTKFFQTLPDFNKSVKINENVGLVDRNLKRGAIRIPMATKCRTTEARSIETVQNLF